MQLEVAVTAVLFGKSLVQQPGFSLDDKAFLTFSNGFSKSFISLKGLRNFLSPHRNM